MKTSQRRRIDAAMKKLNDADKEIIQETVDACIDNGMHHKIEACMRGIGQRHFKPEAIDVAMDDCDNQELRAAFLNDFLFQFAAFEYLIDIDDSQNEGKRDDE